MLNYNKKEIIEMWIKSHMITKLEAYSLAWYVAARHTDIDSVKKHGKKGVLITIGDEPFLEKTSKRDLEELFGGAQSDVLATDILNEARENWNIYHINVIDYSGSRSKVQSQWKQTLGENMVNTQSPEGEDVPELIAGIIIKSYKENNKSVLIENTNLNEEIKVEPEIIL